MTALICGSLAYDIIMQFEDNFENHILPDKTHQINVSFLVPELRQEFGGCAGNIAYNLNLLGGDGLPRGVAGKDFSEYAMWMDDHGISRALIHEFDDVYTARAYITNDLKNNQINAFHPGAMARNHENNTAWPDDVSIGIISPDGLQGMIQAGHDFAEHNIPFMFDPGQTMTQFTKDMLHTLIDQATYVVCNDYEASMMERKSEWSREDIIKKVDAYIVTNGEQGSTIYAGDEVITIPAAPIGKACDPTGCGDAFRAGLLLGLERGFDWPTTGRIASLAGAIKIEAYGCQNHHYTIPEFEARFKKSFNESVTLS